MSYATKPVTNSIRSLPLWSWILLALVGAVLSAGWAFAEHGELPNRIPEPAPYNTAEAQFYPPPYNSLWEGVNAPGNCSNCHADIFEQWNGSMMASSWRDPGWRGAFLLIARLTATDGNCDTPDPPDGSTKAQINPFANGDCTSTFDTGQGNHTLSGSGSLLDDFCSRCHMPTDYIDNIPLSGVAPDAPSGQEHGHVDPNFDPTSDNGTGLAFATLASQYRNTEAGQRGIFCTVCHTMTETRPTPFNNYAKSGTEYVPALGTGTRDSLVNPADIDQLTPSDPASPNLGYSIGAGAFRLSPHAIGQPERFGPLTAGDHSALADSYLSEVFDINLNFQQGDFSGKHDGFYLTTFERSEMCAACHDVTNPLTLKNTEGNWVGGFPIERTYSEWASSRYADRPGNTSYDPAFKRDCQTCHMQQTYGKPGTAQTLYDGGVTTDPLTGQACKSGQVREPFFSHHFIGGNAYIPRLAGASVNSQGNVEPYPELSTYSYSSADPTSIYHNAYWENVADTGAPTQHARLAWDRLRNVLDLGLSGPASAAAGTQAPVSITVTNSGSGHNFPTGFPEGRNAWVALRAFDLATGTELEIFDSFWNRTSFGVGYLTQTTELDPAFDPVCGWTLPAGSPDPYARQFKAVASLGDGCPTLELPYATPLNLVVNANGLPIDGGGTVIDRGHPGGLPQFTDVDGDGDLYDDAYLVDSRLRPLPHADATVQLDRYSVVIPVGTAGPVAVTAAVYYQSLEALVAEKFLGNLADTDIDFLLEPCVLGGACDGRVPSSEPAVVEGAPPVPMEVKNWVITVGGAVDTTPPTTAGTYPPDGAVDTYLDTVPKVFFSEPVTGVDTTAFTLVDDGGVAIPGFVDQISDGAWAFFPEQIFLAGRVGYTARVAAGICDASGNCTSQDIVWTFQTARTIDQGTGDTTVPLGFPAGGPPPGGSGPSVTAVDPSDGQNNVAVGSNIVVTFSEPVMNVDATTFLLHQDGGQGDCSTLGSAVGGSISANGTADVWTFDPTALLQNNRTIHCVTVTTGVTNLGGNPLNDGAGDFTSSFRTTKN